MYTHHDGISTSPRGSLPLSLSRTFSPLSLQSLFLTLSLFLSFALSRSLSLSSKYAFSPSHIHSFSFSSFFFFCLYIYCYWIHCIVVVSPIRTDITHLLLHFFFFSPYLLLLFSPSFLASSFLLAPFIVPLWFERNC